ncbi:hypothetical protein ABC195_01570 [Microbacterium sp. 2P01SA-2]|uniref:hypothetical protein n=1 Tax=unclassified Microbacterium TaxID=2609290 RepID=UPI0039A054C0
MLRLIFFAAVGALAGGAVVEYVGPPDAGWAIMSIALPIAIISGVFILIGRSMAGGVAVSKDDLRRALDARRLGLARVDAIRQTGTQINDQPLCEIDLTVRPLQGEAYATTMRSVVALTELPAFQPGLQRQVVILLDGGPEVAFVDGELSAAEVASLTIPDRSSVRFVPVASHTRISGGRRKGPLIGVGRRRRPLRLLVFAAVAVVVGVAVVMPYREAVAQTAEAVLDGRAHVDMRQPGPLAQAESALEQEIGHDLVSSIYVTPDFVIVEAPVTPGTTHTDRWMYRGGQVEHSGAVSIQPKSATEAFSWRDVDLASILPAMKRAAAESGLPVDDAGATVMRTWGGAEAVSSGEKSGPVQINFSLEDDYERASFRMSADGSGLTGD